MEYRTFGRTGLDVSVIGLGTEYLFKKAYKQSRDNVISVVEEAIKNGVNYFDLIFSISDFLEDLAHGIGSNRSKIILTAHLGSCDRNGRYYKSRSPVVCEKTFERLLEIFNTGYIDIANIHYIQKQEEYDQVTAPGKILDLALKLKEEGKTRFVGMSTHNPLIATQAAKTGHFDMIMIQVNLANNVMPSRNEMLRTCAKEGVAVVAMKIFAGGKLLQKNRKVNIAAHQTGGVRLTKKIPTEITPVKCINYTLSQPGVCTVVPGVKNLAELHECLDYLNASEEDKDYSESLGQFKEYVTGECMYCNHCLPCPSDIDIGHIFRLYDMAFDGINERIQEEYQLLSSNASDCIECGACVKSCPFDVKIIDKMKKCAELFDAHT